MSNYLWQMNLEYFKELNQYCTKNKIKLVAVSKYATNEQIKEAYALGIRDFGENYIIPALKRREELDLASDVIWHLLGPIQKNKINKGFNASVNRFKIMASSISEIS